MEYDKEGDPNYNAWFNLNKQYIPPQFVDNMQESIDLMHFLSSVYFKVMKHLAPALHRLMREQYPVFKKEKRPLVVDYINTVASTTGYALLWKLYKLVNDQRAGVNVREKYPKFDEWVEFYGRPHKPDTINEATRPEYTWLNDAEWEVYRDNENKAFLEFFNWEQKRVFDFIDVVQTLLFKYFKELHELNADELIIYAVDIRDEYEYYLSGCEHAELFIDCGFPEEDMKLTDEEFDKNYSALNAEKKDYVQSLRERRIAGEAI